MLQNKPFALIPPNDAERIDKLHQYDILDTYAEDTFDRIAKLAASIFNAPNAIINFVDVDRVYFKSNLSPEPVIEVPRKEILFSLPILEDAPIVIEDTHEHVQLLESTLVDGPDGIRFYAAAPLITPEGYKVGSICVVDNKPRKVTEDQVKFLKELSVIIVERLESRAAAKKAMKIQVEYMNRTIHDIRNSMTSILMAAEFINTRKIPAGIAKFNDIIYSSSLSIRDRLNVVLDISRIEDENIFLKLEPVSLNSLLDKIIQTFQLSLKKKHQTIVTEYLKDIILSIDVRKITEVFENLISNAIKFSFHNTIIRISTSVNENDVEIGFHDSGQGLNENDMNNLFIKYAKMSSLPTDKERSNGLGLSISKMLVALHNGNIYALSEGKNKGSSFCVSLPILNIH